MPECQKVEDCLFLNILTTSEQKDSIRKYHAELEMQNTIRNYIKNIRVKEWLGAFDNLSMIYALSDTYKIDVPSEVKELKEIYPEINEAGDARYNGY